MGVYVNVKCHACGKSLTGGYTRDYAGVGEPLIECPKCGAANSHASKCTEWELMSRARKIWLVITLGWSTLFYFGGGAALVATILLGDEKIESMTEFGLICGVSILFGFFRLYFYFRRTIRASRTRMNNAAYRKKLVDCGLG